MSGSETRKRTRIVQFRVNDEEYEKLVTAAESARIPMGSYARKVLLDAKPPRVRRKPTLDTMVLTKLLGEFGKVGSNLNQIAKFHNSGRPDFVRPGELERSIKEVSEARAALMKALNADDAPKGPA